MIIETGQALTIPVMLQTTLDRYRKCDAMAFAGEKPMSYETVNERIQAVIAFLEANGIKPGDKAAILSNNMPNWGIVYFAVASMGVVAVPVLPDFSQSEIANVLSHSGAQVVFVSSSLMHKLEGVETPELKIRILIDDFSVLHCLDTPVAYEESKRPSGRYSVSGDDLASIIYTSGTTGRSKGVMLSHRNIVFNAIKGGKIHHLDENDRFLSVLPLSHTYENTLGLILPFLKGSCIYYLRKPPTPPVLLPALEQVKPTAMLTVPLIIEKIYFKDSPGIS